MNILLTGATGFIGKNLINKLIKTNRVTALVRHSSNTNVLPKKTIIFRYNGNDTDLKNYFVDHKIDGVIHLASKVMSDQNNWGNINQLIKSNITLGTKLLEVAKLTNVRWFINTGTFWQHYKNEKYNPVNLYAAMKQAFEDIAKYYTETSNFKFVTIKLCDTFGSNDTRPKIFNLWDNISKTGEKLQMSPGEQIIDITHVDNVVLAYIRLIEILDKKEIDINGKSFALKAERRLKLRDLAELYKKTTGKKLNIKWGGKEYRYREIMDPWEDGVKIPGYKEKTNITDGIKKMMCNNNE